MFMGARTQLIAIFVLHACGSTSDGGGDAVSVPKIDIKMSSDGYVEDADANDNLALMKTECSFANQGLPQIKQFFRSELLGEGYVVKMDVSLPRYEGWSGEKYARVDTSSDCNDPGYTAIVAKDLGDVPLNNLSFAYSCGARCDYTLKSKTLGADGQFTALSVGWVCTGSNMMRLFGTGRFGGVIDKAVGTIRCE